MDETKQDDICRRARDIAGCAWDDRELRRGPLADQLRELARLPRMGTDGDLTDEDRRALRALADEAEE